MKRPLTVDEVSKMLGITHRQIYYGIKTLKITPMWDKGLRRFFFSPDDVKKARKVFQ